VSKAKRKAADDTRGLSREDLIQHLEKLTGRALKTREDIQAYVAEVASRKARDKLSVRRWLKAKQVTLISLLGFGVIQYYVLDVLLEILSLHSTTFFVPASFQTLKSMIVATLA
jgi:hypothetical protein